MEGLPAFLSVKCKRVFYFNDGRVPSIDKSIFLKKGGTFVLQVKFCKRREF
jgi:hypothetical protein